MATATGTNVKFVKVKTTQQYTDYTEKDGALIFVENERKIYVDGIAYGFSDSDVADRFLEVVGGGSVNGSITVNASNTANNITVNHENITFYSGDHMLREIALFRESSGGGIKINVGNTTYEFGENLFVMGGDESVRIGGVAMPISESDVVNLGYLNENVIDKIGEADGIASLDESGKVPSTQLPSYVDDVLEYSAKASFPATGETGKLYVDLSNNKVWRWSGSAYVNVSDGNAHLTLGTTASTAYFGDKGKTAYDHSQLESGNPHKVAKGDVGLGSVANYGIATKTIAETGESNAFYMTPERTAQAIAKLAPKLSWEVVS